MDRAMMARLFAVFQYKNEGTSREARGLKETKGGGSLTAGSSSVKFLAKGCCVYKDSMWFSQRSGKYLEETSVGCYQTDKPHQALEIPQAEKSWEINRTIWWGKYPIFLAVCFLFLRHLLANTVSWVSCLKVPQPTGDKTWEIFSHILLHSEGFREIQGKEEPSLQVLDMLHCSREALDIARILDLHVTAGYWWPGRCYWDWWGFGQFEEEEIISSCQ